MSFFAGQSVWLRNSGRGWGYGHSELGVLAAVQLHEIGVVAALRLGGIGVLAPVQLHDMEAAPADQLAQVPHPAHACDRDSYDGREDRAAE